MIIGKELQDENKYLNKTIGKITDLLTSYGVSSEEQDKEIINTYISADENYEKVFDDETFSIYMKK